MRTSALFRVSLLVMLPILAHGQARTVRKIRGPEKAPVAAGVSHDQCAAAVQQIARSWGSPRLRDHLHPSFPNGPELIDSIRNATLRATNVALQIEAVEGTRFIVSKDGRFTDCIADVSTRLQFDDPETGARSPGTAGRAQWRIRFDRVPQ